MVKYNYIALDEKYKNKIIMLKLKNKKVLV